MKILFPFNQPTKIFFATISFLVVTKVISQEAMLINSFNRPSTSLNGYWKYIVDPYENGYYNYRYQPFEDQENTGNGAYFTNAKPKNKMDLVEYDFDLSDSLKVPGDWNTQKEKLIYYEGTLWYKKSFNYIKKNKSNRVFVHFGAANYNTDVYLNGRKLGKHTGGFTPFNFEITDLIKEKDNFLIVKVDNKRIQNGVPTLNTDWWNFGGITRGVELVEVSSNFISDYFFHLDKKDPKKIIGQISLNGKEIGQKKVTVKIPELKIEKVITTNSQGNCSFNIESKNLELWSVDNPKLYSIEIQSDNDKIVDQIGFRSIKTDGKHILLNDEKIFLKGISIHEESPIRGGRAYSEEDAKILLGWAKDLGCNFVRLAHYPHNEQMIRLADKMGILVWEENPVYWTISWNDPDTYLNAENQLTEVIRRDKNRAAVIIWSMANETPTSDARTTFLTKLANKTRSLDATRLISAALEQSSYKGDEFTRTIDDPFAEVVDILSFNQYVGWYDGTPEKCNKISWKIDQQKPVLISEFGGGAKQGFHGDKNERWTEEYQEYLYQETLKMIQDIDQLQGFSPWILVDFRSPRRTLPKIQDGWNRKGLISDEGIKKKAFFVLQEFYQKNK